MHRLQALSLQLTYDNLMIVIHRPLLADQSHKRSRVRNNNSHPSIDSNGDPARLQYTSSTHHASFGQCLSSALRISRVQLVKRNLIALARRTHLVSFLGMNLFTSSVVMFICALSDTLSDVAQEAKRGMARNLKVLKLLSGEGSLSMQCSMILEDLVQKIIEREKEEMLHSQPSDDEVTPFLPTRRSSYVDGHAGIVGVGTGSAVTWQTSDELKRAHDSADDQLSGDGSITVQRTMASLQKGITTLVKSEETLTCLNYSLQGSRHTKIPIFWDGVRDLSFKSATFPPWSSATNPTSPTRKYKNRTHRFCF